MLIIQVVGFSKKKKKNIIQVVEDLGSLSISCHGSQIGHPIPFSLGRDARNVKFNA